MNDKNLFYVKCTRNFKYLIDTGAAVSVVKPHVIPENRLTKKENIIISGISGEELLISKSFSSDFGKSKDSISVYVCDLQIEFDGIFGMDFLKTYKCIINIPDKSIQANFGKLKLLSENHSDFKNNHPVQKEMEAIKIRPRCIQTHQIATNYPEGEYLCPEVKLKRYNTRKKIENINATDGLRQTQVCQREGADTVSKKKVCPHNVSKGVAPRPHAESADRVIKATRARETKDSNYETNTNKGYLPYCAKQYRPQEIDSEKRSKCRKGAHSANVVRETPDVSIATSGRTKSYPETNVSQREMASSRTELKDKIKINSCLRSLKGVQSRENERKNSMSQTTIKPLENISDETKTKQITAYNVNEKTFPSMLGDIKIPEAIVTVKNGSFLTTIVNLDETCDLVELPQIELIKIENKQFVNIIENSENTPITMDENRFNNIKQTLRLDHLNFEEKDHITKLCLKYPEIFYLEGDKLTFSNRIKHSIKTTDPNPIFTKSYRYPYVHKQEIKKQIDKLLEQGIIQPSFSPWSSPVWIVPKKMDASGIQKWRLVIDYRKLNCNTVKDVYPLPNITDLLDQLGKCKYFSTIDLCSGFHQIEVEEEDREKTAFTVENGHWEFSRLPFGLSNSPRTFSRVMDNVLSGLQGEQCLCYMDDIIVYSATLEEHIDRLENVFNRLATSNLKIQPDKCEFLRKEVAYLGHVVTPEGIKPNPAKIEAVVNFPQPRNPKEIKQFLGLSGYYRRFLPNYAQLVKPLTSLLKKNVEFTFNEKCVKAFERCKVLLTTAPILQYPDFEKDFIITTDASLNAIGAVLSQGEPGADLPIFYASRTLNPAETRYSAIERELLSIVWATKHFRPYIYGRKFTIYSDHKPLEWLMSVKDPGSRLVRWRLKLAEYDYEIKYKAGKLNTNADALSRIPINVMTEITKEIINTPINPELVSYSEIYVLHKNHKNILYVASETHIQSSSSAYDACTRLIEKDVPIFPILKKGEITVLDSVSKPNRKYYMLNSNTKDKEQLFNDLNKNKNELPLGEIYVNFIDKIHLDRTLSLVFKNEKDRKFIICKGSITVPKIRDIPELIQNFHTAEDSYHKGINETLRKIKTRYYWKNMTRDVTKFVRQCEICAKAKTCRQSLKRPLTITDTPIKPFFKIYIDIFEFDKNKYLTILDAFSKYSQCYKVRHETTKEVVEKLKLYISHHPTPMQIVTDNGACFISKDFKRFCQDYDIQLKFISAHHSQSNAVERLHATLADSLRCFAEECPNLKDTEILTSIMRSYNNCRSASTHFTPFEIIYGDINLNNYIMINEDSLVTNKKENYRKELINWQNNLHKLVHNNIIKNKEKSKEYHDEKFQLNKTTYKIGDQIMIKNPDSFKKHQPRFLGPFQILGLLNDTTAIIKQNFKSTPIHFDRIKLYVHDSDTSSNSDSDDSDKETNFPVCSQDNTTGDTDNGSTADSVA